MGVIHYAEAQRPIHVEDYVLAHLKVVIVTKLRRNESFTLSWQHVDHEPVGRSTIWLHPAIPLRFEFDDASAPELDADFIHEMAHSANSTGGIALLPEHMGRLRSV